MIFFSSDQHFGHERICELSNRPFCSVTEMNEQIIENYNSKIEKEDEVYFIGDVCLGKISESLKLIKRLNGKKYLISGNHDRTSKIMSKTLEKVELWEKIYKEAGFERIQDSLTLEMTFGNLFLSHFPISGDSQEKDRFLQFRPVIKENEILIHGHTHSLERVSLTKNLQLQIHVGVDAWDFFPVSEIEIKNIIRNNKLDKD
jgi:calcineurin-like phosphoesterase family protein